MVLRCLCGGSVSRQSAANRKQSAAEEAEAFDSCEQFVRQWQKRRELLVYLVRKDRLAEVEAAIVRLGPLLEEQGDEFSAELDTVQILLYRLIQGEAPLVSNIL